MTDRVEDGRIERLSDAKRALLERRRRDHVAAQAAALPEAGPAPTLSFAQERMWLLEQVTPGMAAYNTTRLVRLDGVVDVDRLRLALRAVVRRHQVLRTRIERGDDGRPTASLGDDDEVSLDVVSVADDRAAERFLQAFALRPFDLGADTLLRAALVRVVGGEDLLVLSLHHIASDGASRAVLWRDLSAAYAAAAAGSVTLPPLPVQYSDFAVAQRAALDQPAFDEELAWWQAYIDGAPPQLDLPLSWMRPAVQSYSGARQVVTVSPDLLAALRSLARDHATTLFTTVVAPFIWLLSRWAHQDEVVVGMPVSGRDQPNTDELIGLFVNTLALRTDCSGSPSYADLIERVRTGIVDVLAHQHMPFEKLVEAVAPKRELSRNPIFQVLVNAVAREDDGIYSLGETTARAVDFSPGTTKFDIGMLVSEHPDGRLDVVLEYDQALFSAEAVEDLGEQLLAVLEAGVRDPSAVLAPASAMTDGQRRRLVIDANATDAPVPAGCVPDRFAEQAGRTPDAPAAGDDDAGWFTYRQLDERANQLAHHLRALGVRPGKAVAVAVPRSVAMEIAVLAILKAGGAYVPLDPGYPAERLAYMLVDSQAAVLITHTSLGPLLPPHPTTVWIDQVQGDLDAQPVTAPDSGVGPSDLAYVIYTSGSTGRPKGVMIEHVGLMNRLAWMQEAFGLSADDTVLQKTPLSFDVSVWEVLWPLVTGARLFLARPDGHRDVDYLTTTIREQSVSVCHFVPSMLSAFLDATRPADLDSLRLVVCSGEELGFETKERFFALLSGTALHNLYGPTEASIDVTWFPCLPGRAQPVRIGRPISNTQVYVLDDEGRPLPAGMPGELHLGGIGLARGYLGQPELTAERFVPHPLEPGDRLYRTGDLVRWTSDAQLDYLGRLDDQVKLRGFRIELGEVETALTSHPAVIEAVAALLPMPSGEPALAAYVVLAPDEPLTAPSQAAAVEETVGDWHTVWEQTYSTGDVADPHFDTRGWVSSFTNRAIPDLEMAEWVQRTVERINEVAGPRILEVGCGSGLLTWRLAPKAERYTATDFSVEVIHRLHRQLAEERLPQLTATALPADRINELAAERFDTVIANSVVQYFPDAEYLSRMLRDAVDRVASSGTVFVGDVRSLPLQRAFYLRAHRDLVGTPRDLIARIDEMCATDTELVVDPSFFHALVADVAAVTHVQVMPKRGQHHNEMNCFRYDVLIHVGKPAPLDVSGWEDWDTAGLDLARLTARLAEGPELVAVRGIPDARVTDELDALAKLAEAVSSHPVDETGDVATRSVEPDALWQLAVDHGYHVELGVSDSVGHVDAVFSRRDAGPFRMRRSNPSGRPSSNQPAHARQLRARERAVVGELRHLLENRLPDYMMPSGLRVIDRLPRTPSGKLDRSALPQLVDLRDSAEIVPPRSATEMALVELWRGLLGVQTISVTDDFFRLGGHSLLAVRLVAAIEGQLRVRLPLSTIFESPSIAALAEAVDAAIERDGTRVPSPINAVDRAEYTVGGSDELPLSAAQERMWFLDQLSADTPLYTVRRAYRVHGNIDAGTLQEGLQILAARHDSLRTTIVSRGDEVVQRVAPLGQWPLDVADVSNTADPFAAANELAQVDARRRFDLEAGPLATARLIRLNDHDHMLILRFHHIIVDGRSVDVLVDELAASYRQLHLGDSPALPPVAVQYPDFVLWQRDAVVESVLESQLEYWRTELAGAPPSVELPTDRPRPSAPSYRGGRISLSLGAELTEAVSALARSTASTPFTVLVAGVSALLARLSGQDDIVLGTPVSGRQRDEIDRTVGLFANTVVLRADTAGDPRFAQLVDRARRTVGQAQAHQDVPFERLVTELRPERDLSRNPLFQIMVNLQPSADGQPDLGPTRLVPQELDAVSARFDLTFSFAERDGVLHLALEYATDLFEVGSVAVLGERLVGVLVAGVGRPWLRLSGLPVLVAGERSRLLGWGGGVTPGPVGGVTPELVAGWVRVCPDRVAVSGPDVVLTYRELWERAGWWGQRIAAVAAPGSRVAVGMGRSAMLVVAAVAVWRAGCAYVPLDPSFPWERLRVMVDDADVAVVVTDAGSVSGLPVGDRPVIVVDAAEPAAVVADRLEGRGWSAEDPAYLIYTSGSTGVPKGVVVGHGALVNLLGSMRVEPGFSETDAMLSVTTFSFDMVIPELFLPLVAGGRVVIAAGSVVVDPVGLAGLIEAESVTVMQATPSLWRLLVESGWSPSRPVRALCGGEALPADVAAGLLGRVAELWNCYGPTETTVWSTLARVSDPAAITIGTPIANTRVYVLDRDRQLVAPGVRGQLWIGGAGLAAGYWNRPELTAARFVEDPEHPGQRIYDTGDLAYWTGDGQLVCLGRADNQVKLRGYRIELGEIDTILQRHPQVSEAVTTLREDTPGDQRLVAYLTATPDLDIPDLLNHTRHHLPAYMIPTTITVLDHIPRTPNGKIDRNQLAAVVPDHLDADAEVAMTETEQRLAEIWSDVLRVPVRSATAHFFDLGGHSLMATRLLARVADEFDVALPLQVIFETPTLSAMAEQVARHLGGPAGPQPVSRDGRRLASSDLSDPELVRAALAGEAPKPTGSHAVTVVPASSAQRRFWILHAMRPDGNDYNVTVLRHIDGEIDSGRLAAALDIVVRRHEVLRTTFLQHHNDVAQLVHDDRGVNLELIDLPDATPDLLDDTARDRALQPFDLGSGPLFRAALLRGGTAGTRLLLAAHHIVLDGWSIDTLLAELAAAYDAPDVGRAPALQLGDYAIWEAQRTSTGAAADDAAYWSRQLVDAPPVTRLPVLREPGELPEGRGGRIRRTLSPATAASLAQLAQARQATPFQVLTSTVALLLQRHGADRDVVLGTPFATRAFAGGGGLIGPLINTLALRVQIRQGSSFESLIDHVAQVSREAYQHGEYPFEQIVSDLDIPRQSNRHPLFQVLVSMQEQRTDTPRLGPARLLPVDMQWGVARYDLAFLFSSAAESYDIGVEYREGAFDEPSAGRLLDRLITLLDAALRAPNAEVDELTVLPPTEVEQLKRWGGPPDATNPPDLCDLIRDRVRRHPTRTAVEAADGSLSFAELDRASTHLAASLRRRGVGDEEQPFVGIATGHSVHWPVAVLAAWKLGAAFVPIDPTYPTARQEFMLADAGCRTVVTDLDGLERLRDLDVDLVCAELDPPATGAIDVLELAGDVADRAAYLIYTSGSTGQPKGVVVSRRSLAHLVHAVHQTLHGGADDSALRVSVNYPVSFDGSIEQLLHLGFGHSLILVPDDVRLDPMACVDFIADHGLEMFDATPTHVRMLIDAGLLSRTPQLKLMFVGGEAIEPELWSALRGCDKRVVNCYGPTEVSVLATTADVAETATPVIGRPIPGVRVRLLDADQRLVPIGAPGEVWLGGPQVAFGYLGQPGLTAERFHTDGEGERWYRSGDVARYLESGRLEFLGRTDEQVKIRGHRVEPAEVATLIERQPDVSRAAVIAVRDAMAGSTLVGFVVARDPASFDATQLRDTLRSQLPRYLVPSALSVVASLPTSPSGKLDAKELTRMAASLRLRPAPSRPPANEAEQLVADLFVALLPVSEVGADDDFFDLGGNSLLAAALVTKLRAIGIDIPLLMVFNRPTVVGVAGLVLDALITELDHGQHDRSGETTPTATTDS